MAKVTPPDQTRLQERLSAPYSAEEGHPSLKALAALLGRTAAREHWDCQLLQSEARETASAGTPGLIPASAPEVPGSESETGQASLLGAVLPDLHPLAVSGAASSNCVTDDSPLGASSEREDH